MNRCGVAIDALDYKGRTALSWAARRGDARSTNILLQAQADPDLADVRGQTPLLLACEASSTTCVDLLLEAGANYNHINSDQMNALHCALQRKDNEQIIEDLIAVGVNMNAQDIWGSTPLAHAVSIYRATSTEVLLKHGAEKNIQDYEGDTALHNSFHVGAVNLSRLLLERGANPNLINYSGNTVLHVAAISGGLQTLEVLNIGCLDGIDVDAINNQGESALYLAQQRDEKPEQFVEQFQALLASIRDRGTKDMERVGSFSSRDKVTAGNDSDSTEWNDIFVDAPELPLEK